MKKYKSKIDAWLAILVFGTVILSAWPVFYEAFSWICAIIYAILLAFLFHIFFIGTYYIIDNNRLIVTCGFMSQSISIQKISEITRTRTLLSSPALSIDCIKLRYGKRNFMIISPRKREEFVADLLNINPNITVSL